MLLSAMRGAAQIFPSRSSVRAFVRGALKSAGPECSITRGRDPLETSHNLCDCCFVGLFLSPAVTFCRAALDGCVSFFRFECA
jgi:hypothetical protein